MHSFETALEKLKQMLIECNIEKAERKTGGPLSATEKLEITMSTIELIETVGINNE